MPRNPIAVRLMPGCRGRVPASELRRIAHAVLEHEGVAREVGLEVVLADEATVRDLNRLYRGRDEPTDVLSFAAHEGEAFVDAPGAEPSLGEVVVCLPYAESQAAATGMPVAGQVAHLVVHGTLHVLGFDHEAGQSAAVEMQSREEALLDGLGYAGRYEHGH